MMVVGGGVGEERRRSPPHGERARLLCYGPHGRTAGTLDAVRVGVLQFFSWSRRVPLTAVYDRAPRIMAPLVRHGKTVSLIGGLLVAAIGVAMVFYWLAILPRYFNFNTAI